jgi:hypothetical protein
MYRLAVAFAASCLLIFGTPASSELLVSDSFESGDMFTTNAADFRWSGPKVTSVVTEVFVTSPVNLPAPEASQWETKTGKRALMLRYRAGKSWMSFWLRVPTHYSHPKAEGANDNQKLFRLRVDVDGQKGDGSTVAMSYRGDGDGVPIFLLRSPEVEIKARSRL